MKNFASGFALVGGARLYYEMAGRGRPLILLHAGVGDSRMWDDQFAAFAERYRVIRYDARGYGKSEMVSGAYSNHDDLYGIMQHLGIERAFLLGCSIGGKTAVDFTLAHPAMATALILVGSGLSGYEGRGGTQEQHEAMEAAYTRGNYAETAEIIARIWVDGPSRTPEQVDAAIRQKVREMQLIALQTPDGLGEELPADPPAINRLGSIRTPTLVIYGDLDQPNILTIAGLLANRIPGAQKAVIPGTAHVSNMEKPGEFNKLVLDFLAGL